MMAVTIQLAAVQDRMTAIRSYIRAIIYHASLFWMPPVILQTEKKRQTK